MKQAKGIRAFNAGKGGGKAPSKGAEQGVRLAAERRESRAARLHKKGRARTTAP